jgi:hypothetical protein
VSRVVRCPVSVRAGCQVALELAGGVVVQCDVAGDRAADTASDRHCERRAVGRDRVEKVIRRVVGAHVAARLMDGRGDVTDLLVGLGTRLGADQQVVVGCPPGARGGVRQLRPLPSRL